MQFFRVRETHENGRDPYRRANLRTEPDRRIRRDSLKEDMIQTRQLAQQMRRDVQELVDMLLSTPNMEQRTVGIGRLDPEMPVTSVISRV